VSEREEQEPEPDLAELLTTPAKLLFLSSLLVGGLGFWAAFVVFAEINMGFPLLAPLACGVLACGATLGLGRVGMKLLGIGVLNDAEQ
jgi:hypothetical protein